MPKKSVTLRRLKNQESLKVPYMAESRKSWYVGYWGRFSYLCQRNEPVRRDTILRKRVMEQIGLSHRPKRKPNGLTKADREAMKSDDLLKRDFRSDTPLEKCITDITEIPAANGKLYVSAIFDCFDLSVLGLAMGTNMKADLCIHTLENALTAYPALEGAVIHSDRGTQYTSESYRQTIREHHIHQSMNSAGGRCHDNARCESMWARMKTEFPQLLK